MHHRNCMILIACAVLSIILIGYMLSQAQVKDEIEVEIGKVGTDEGVLVNGERQVGIMWIVHFPDLDDLEYADDTAKGFRDRMVELNDGIGVFDNGDSNAKERYMRDYTIEVPSGSGQYGWDNYTPGGFDTVDFAWFQSHGGKSGSGSQKVHTGVFTTSINQNRYYSDQLFYGENYDLEYLIIHSCYSLDAENNDWFYMWNQTFKGLHMIFGFSGTAHCSYWTRNEGKVFAECLHDGYTFIQAWHEAISDAWYTGDTSAVMWCGTSGSNLNERANESLTNVYPDIANPTDWRVDYNHNDW